MYNLFNHKHLIQKRMLMAIVQELSLFIVEKFSQRFTEHWGS